MSNLTKPQITGYLKGNRLQDLLALIQILALRGESSHWTEEEIRDAFKGVQPAGKMTWIDVARDHPEFFRVSETDNANEPPAIALLMRYGLGHVFVDGRKVRPPLSSDLLRTLFDIANKMYDNQWDDYVQKQGEVAQNREERQKWIIASIVAGAGFLGSILGAFVKALVD